jgi:phosphoadenosine phosphosulfate reductase
VRRRYGIYDEVHLPDAREVEAMVRRAGPNLFYDSVEKRLSCCHVRKVLPLARALGGFDAWVSGVRRDQTQNRAGVPKVAIDPEHGGILKLNPLADWSWEQVEAYVRFHDVPEHPLYRRGYTSIGCAPCTRPVQIGEDRRAGRWWWEDGGQKECGLHLPRRQPALAQA